MKIMKCKRCQSYMSKIWHKLSNHERYCKLNHEVNSNLIELKRLK